MPIISKKQDIKLIFTNIILENNLKETEIDFELYDKDDKLYLKAFKNKKNIFDWPLDSIKEVLEFINSKVKFKLNENEFFDSIKNNSNVIEVLPQNNISSAVNAGGKEEFESFLSSKKNEQNNYTSPSSIVSNPSFLGAIGSDAGAISDSVINKMLNISAIEIDLESEDMGNEG
jgi:hypothetical protein